MEPSSLRRAGELSLEPDECMRIFSFANGWWLSASAAEVQ
jgi:hypothetical protein